MSHITIGLLLAGFGHVMIVLADTLSKYVQEDMAFLQVILARQLIQFFLMGLLWKLFFAAKQKFVIPPIRSLQFARNGLMVVMIFLYISSLKALDIGVAISLLNTAPFFALPFAVLLLKERVSATSILAIIIGFIGVLLIVQPGFESFQVEMLAVLAAAAIIGLYTIVSRKLASDMHPINFLCYQGAVLSIVYMPFAIIFWQPIPSELWGWLIVLSLLSCGFHLCFLTAIRHLEANRIAPLMYIEVIGGLFFGYLFFETVPNWLALCGIAVITVAGLMMTLQKSRPS